MANHIRMDDPMDAMYSKGFSVDLTRGNKNIPDPDSVSLDSLSGNTSDDLINTEEVQKEEAPQRTVEIVDAKMSQDVQEFDPTTLIPKKEKFDPGRNELMDALDMAVEREKANITERHRALEEAMYEDYINSSDEEDEIDAPVQTTTPTVTTHDEDEDEDVFDDEVTVSKNYKISEDKPVEETKTNKVTVQKTVSEEIDYDEDEVDSDFDDEDITQPTTTPSNPEEDMNDLVEGLKTAARSTIRNNTKTIDLSKFKIGNRGVKSSTVILREEKNVDTADWVMYEAKHPIAMSALTGPELIKLDPENSSRNRYNTLRDIYKIIYDHVVDSNKVSFDMWLKQTRYADLDHIYFALYMATFHGSNFISYQCPDCKKVFIQDVNFKSMVKYKSDEVEENVKDIMSMSTDNGEIKYDVELVPVNDTYVFGMRSPSLYNIAVETAGLPEKLLEKYADLIDTITYIDSVYVIDYTNMELTPVIIPTVKNDPVKSTAKKIKTMYNILKTLSSDEYYILRGFIAKLADTTSEISYLIPGATCPDCDKAIEANENATAQDLLFTRHHLGAFANL